jgi:hypothetical protein
LVEADLPTPDAGLKAYRAEVTCRSRLKTRSIPPPWRTNRADPPCGEQLIKAKHDSIGRDRAAIKRAKFVSIGDELGTEQTSCRRLQGVTPFRVLDGLGRRRAMSYVSVRFAAVSSLVAFDQVLEVPVAIWSAFVRLPVYKR